MRFVDRMEEAFFSTDMIVESVTTKGLRKVLPVIKEIPSALNVPFCSDIKRH